MYFVVYVGAEEDPLDKGAEAFPANELEKAFAFIDTMENKGYTCELYYGVKQK